MVYVCGPPSRANLHNRNQNDKSWRHIGSLSAYCGRPIDEACSVYPSLRGGGLESDAEFTSLAAAIAGARKRAGLTQREAADKIGMSHRSWQDWERGAGDAVSNLPKIEQALELERGWFSAQLGVLERLSVYEARLIGIEEKLDECLQGQRDIIGLLRLSL